MTKAFLILIPALYLVILGCHDNTQNSNIDRSINVEKVVNYDTVRNTNVITKDFDEGNFNKTGLKSIEQLWEDQIFPIFHFYQDSNGTSWKDVITKVQIRIVYHSKEEKLLVYIDQQLKYSFAGIRVDQDKMLVTVTEKVGGNVTSVRDMSYKTSGIRFHEKNSNRLVFVILQEGNSHFGQLYYNEGGNEYYRFELG